MAGKNKDLDLKALKPALIKLARGAGRYAGIICFVVVATIYGFVLFRINSLNNVQPSDTVVSAQSSKITTIPRIDPQIVQQLEALKDNSVNVNTLFEQARNNPFQ
jgi:hypothetical protein